MHSVRVDHDFHFFLRLRRVGGHSSSVPHGRLPNREAVDRRRRRGRRSDRRLLSRQGGGADGGRKRNLCVALDRTSTRKQWWPAPLGETHRHGLPAPAAHDPQGPLPITNPSAKCEHKSRNDLTSTRFACFHCAPLRLSRVVFRCNFVLKAFARYERRRLGERFLA